MTTRKSYLSPVLALMALAHLVLAAQDTTLSLAGRWRFQLDRADAGVSERWFARQLPEAISLPGGLTEQGIGDPATVDTKWTGGIVDKSWFTAPEFERYRQPGNVKVPFWLQPERYYAGPAWFQREVEIPGNWVNERVALFLERPHWETRVWVDDRPVGTNNALATPHEHDLGRLAPGKHMLTVRVDNRMVIDVGENSHSVSDHTQGNWNGIVGRIELRATPAVWIDDLQVYPDPGRKAATVKLRIGNLTGRSGSGQVELVTASASGLHKPRPATRFPVQWSTDGGGCEMELSLGEEAEQWDEFHPSLYDLSATLTTADGFRSVARTRFGLRGITVQGTQFAINGRKVFFRGTLECCIFPKTGHPPTDLESWRRIIGVAKGFGLNMLRFHSWCPPEAAFAAADELGFYLHVECSSWANQSTTLGDGKPVDEWIYAETDRILKAYGNHPSFVLLLYGNEPGGDKHKEYLARWVEQYKARDPRRLYSAGAGWPQLPENQFHVTPDPRIQGWGEGLKSRINAKPPETTTDYRAYVSSRTVPVISHEIGQWCVYPNFDEIAKYTGYLKARNFEIFRERLEASGLGRFARPFLLASGKLQALCYKEDIESALRTPGMAGFQLLDLHDFPGQGTALVGVVDPFWDEKGYVTAREYSRFCSSTVPLARLKKRVFTTGEKLEAELEVAHFGAAPIRNARARWVLESSRGVAVHCGNFAPGTIEGGSRLVLGRLSLDLKDTRAPAAYKLVVSVERAVDAAQPSEPTSGGERPLPPQAQFENDWDVWVYPAQAAAAVPQDVIVTSRFDDAAQRHLRAGGKVLLTIPGSQVRNFDTAPVMLGFSSIFWNTAWTGRQAPTTLGVLCDPKHPALALFPTEEHSNWQWWYLIHRAGALRLDLLPSGAEPVVRVIDDWFTARPLGLVVEGKVGSGGIVVCGLDLTRDADDPVSRQMLTSLTRYLGSERFKPATEFTLEQIRNLIR